MTKSAKTVVLKRWLCDVCRLASFFDYDEACRHEEQCKGPTSQMDQTTVDSLQHSKHVREPVKTDIAPGKGLNSGETSPTVVAPSAPTTSSSGTMISNQSGENSMPTRSVSDDDEVMCWEKEESFSASPIATSQVYSTRKATRSSKRIASQNNLPNKLVTKLPLKLESSHVDCESSQREKRITRPSGQHLTKPLEFFKSRPAVDQEVEWDQETLAEQAAAAFQIKRRLCREKEQVRNRKRKELQRAPEKIVFSDENALHGTSFATEEAIKGSIALENFYSRRQRVREKELERQRKRHDINEQVVLAPHGETTTKETKEVHLPGVGQLNRLAPRYPLPSHIISSPILMNIDQRRSYSWIPDSAILKSHELLCKTANYTGNSQHLETVLYCSKATLPNISAKLSQNCSFDPLYKSLNKIPMSSISSDVDGSNSLWVEKYAIENLPDDVCGKFNRIASEQMLAFVKEWKVERQKSHERRQEKHRALSKARRVYRKRRPIDDDDLWGDNDADKDNLCSVCLITGPVGSGKTNLVHAVARQSGCKLLEINTTERRGGQCLRRAIEEATRSYSSLDMLQQREIVHVEARDIVDSDSDDDDEKQGSSLVVVLIDEVDNLFEDDGDSGFWSALSKVTSKSQSPIFLTASSAPQGLLAANIRFTHINTSRPDPAECASKILEIVGLGKASFKDDRISNESTTSELIAHVAELCGCDMRKIMNELEVLKLSSEGIPTSTNSDISEVQTASNSLWSPFCVMSVDPKWVPYNRFSLMTIKGQNFSVLISMYIACMGKTITGVDVTEACLDVTVSGCICPRAKILDDSTIIAVCPPFGNNDRGLHKSMTSNSMSVRYGTVSVMSRSKLGAISCSDSLRIAHSDKAATVTLFAKVNMEYNFPRSFRDHHQTNHALESDDENEWMGASKSDGELSSDHIEGDDFCDPPSVDKMSTVNDLMKRAFDEYKDTHSDIDKALPCNSHVVKPPDYDELTLIDKLAEEASMISDATFLEDFESLCLPLLSGPVRGFGATLVDSLSNVSVSKQSHKPSAKPPSEERLFATGWKDSACFYGSSDAYCTIPVHSRERRLLKQSQLTREHFSLPDTLLETLLAPGQEPGLLESAKPSTPLEIADVPVTSPEDMLLPSPCSSIVTTTLPFILRNHCGPAQITDTQSRLLEAQRTRSAENASKWLDHLLEGEAKARIFRSELARPTFHACLPSNCTNELIFLDYLPILRTMGELERAAEDAFRQALEKDPDFLSLQSTRRRQTRSSQSKRSRLHYFESISPQLARDELDLTAKELGSEMASTLLTCNRFNE